MPKWLFYFGVTYMVYSFSAFPIGEPGRRELKQLLAKLSSTRWLRPLYPVGWMLVLPYENLVAALCLSVIAILLALVLL